MPTTANDHHHSLEAIESRLLCRSWLRVISTVGSDKKLTKIPILAEDHQHLLLESIDRNLTQAPIAAKGSSALVGSHVDLIEVPIKAKPY